MKVILQAQLFEGFSAGLHLVPVALSQLRTRILSVCDDLDADEWQVQSRCELWSVHDVVRHVRDACRIHVAMLRGESTTVFQGEPFNARETPRQWLERTAGQPIGDTVSELRDCCAMEELVLRERLADYADALVAGPYGEIHWTILTAHVLWDAWLHARDVTEVLGKRDHSTAGEHEVSALYSLLIASMPAARKKHNFDLTVGLTGDDGKTYAASVVPGSVTLGTVQGLNGTDLRGDLAVVADALAGRGPELASVLDGSRSVMEPLTWLRATLRPEAPAAGADEPH